MNAWWIELGELMLGPATPFELVQVRGLTGPAPVVADDIVQQGMDGVTFGVDTYGPRTIELVIEHVAGTQAECLADQAALAGAMARVTDGTVPIRWQLPGQLPRRLDVRPRRCELDPIDAVNNAMFGRAALQLVCDQPYLLEDLATVDAAVIAAGQGGAEVMVWHAGTGHAAPVIRWAGPTRNPRLTHATLGRAIRIDVDIPVGSELVVDVAARTVALDGADVYTATRADNQWWRLARGANVLLASRDTSALTGADAAVSVEHRTTWTG